LLKQKLCYSLRSWDSARATKSHKDHSICHICRHYKRCCSYFVSAC